VIVSFVMAVTLVMTLTMTTALSMIVVAVLVLVSRHILIVVPVIAHEEDPPAAGVVLRTMLALTQLSFLRVSISDADSGLKQRGMSAGLTGFDEARVETWGPCGR
jgi:hypothetical protein